MIENIKIEKLHPHPDNPRKDIGDVTELAESIKTSGVLQNLTVVPATGHYHGDYTVIIGHRRLAAAKLAGLEELPCAIMEMDKKEQIATMLLENMQRSDLTPYEEAQGMQMMLDLGETIENISQKTGFSESTIRRRTKLLKLDQNEFKRSQERQVTFLEYDKLFEIENEEKRNELLKHIGTKNFDNELLRAKDEQKKRKKQDEIIAKVKEFAIEISSDYESHKDKVFVKSIWQLNQVEEIEIIADANYYFYSTEYGYIYVYRDYTEEEKQKAEALEKAENENRQKAAAENERRERLRALDERMYQLRFDFIKNCPDTRCKTNAIAKFAIFSFVQEWSEETDIEQFEELIGHSIVDEEEGPLCYEYSQEVKDNPQKVLLYAAYASFGDGAGRNYSYGDGTYREDDDMDSLYTLLKHLGYEISDEEQQWRDGTHPLYEVIK